MQYRCSPLFKSWLYTISILQKTYLSTSFHGLKEIQRGFSLLRKEAKVKTTFIVSLAGAIKEAVPPPAARAARRNYTSPELHFAPQYQAP